MNRLTKTQVTELGNHRSAIETARDDLEQAVADFNEAVSTAWWEVEEARDTLNTAIEAADTWRADVAAAMEEYFEDRSETWQQGETGSAFGEWWEAWQEDLSPVELDQPDEAEMPEVDAADVLDNLSEEVGG